MVSTTSSTRLRLGERVVPRRQLVSKKFKKILSRIQGSHLASCLAFTRVQPAILLLQQMLKIMLDTSAALIFRFSLMEVEYCGMPHR